MAAGTLASPSTTGRGRLRLQTVQRHAFAAICFLCGCLITRMFVCSKHEVLHMHAAMSLPGDNHPMSSGAHVDESSKTVAQTLAGYNVYILDENKFFSYVAKGLHLALKELGVKHKYVKRVRSCMAPNDLYIMFDAHHPYRLPRNFIAYNYEQLITTKVWPPEFFERLKGAVMVWDYSRENIKVLNGKGVNRTVHLPLGYARNMENKYPPVPRDLDILFAGAKGGTGTRDRKLLQINAFRAQPPWKTKFVHDTFDDALLKLYRRSKVSLNLHFYAGRTILEVHRILPLIVSKVLVLSEPSDDPWWDHEYKDLVNFAGGDDIISPLSSLLGSVDIGAETEKRYQMLLSCCRYTRYVSAALGQVPGPLRPQNSL